MSTVRLLQQVTSIINLEHSSWTKETPLLYWCLTGRAHGSFTVCLVLSGNASQLQVKSESDFKFLCTKDPTKDPTLKQISAESPFQRCWHWNRNYCSMGSELNSTSCLAAVGGSIWVDEIPGNQKSYFYRGWLLPMWERCLEIQIIRGSTWHVLPQSCVRIIHF